MGLEFASASIALAASGPAHDADLVWRRRARPMLGTLVEVAVLGCCDAAFVRLSDLAFACVARYHAAMSFHDALSDVRRIASARQGETLVVQAQTWEVIAAALSFEAASGGIFSVAVAAELVARGHLPMPACSGAAVIGGAASGSECLRLEKHCQITVVRPVWIDLGGIAKGAAVDAALDVIRLAGDAGVVGAIVNAGGDMAVFGERAQPITVLGPGGVHVRVGSLADGAVATSGPFAGADRSTLVTPHCSVARWADRSVSVIAPSCLVADALTKVLAVLGPEAAPLLRRYAALGFSVDDGGHVEHVE